MQGLVDHLVAAQHIRDRAWSQIRVLADRLAAGQTQPNSTFSHDGYLDMPARHKPIHKLKVGARCPLHGPPCTLESTGGIRRNTREQRSRFVARGFEVLSVNVRPGAAARSVVVVEGPALVFGIGDSQKLRWSSDLRDPEHLKFDRVFENTPWRRGSYREGLEDLVADDPQSLVKEFLARLDALVGEPAG
jgi:hypothetical protein